MNSVTNGDFKRPLHVSQFVAELNSGFRLLNLKNDGLRKRFDALKYDVKKIEEVGNVCIWKSLTYNSYGKQVIIFLSKLYRLFMTCLSEV